MNYLFSFEDIVVERISMNVLFLLRRYIFFFHKMLPCRGKMPFAFIILFNILNLFQTTLS